MNTYQQLKEQMVDVCRNAFNNKLFAGTSGNLSVYLREEARMLITPTCVRYETMTADDIVVMNTDGTMVEGKYRPSSEWPMHGVIYEQCAEVNSVFHTHSPYATSFAVVRQAIPLILIEMMPFLGGEVYCARMEKPGSRELGLSAIEELKKGRNACLLANHGVVAVGGNLAQSYIRAEYVEDAAKIYHHALQVAEPVIIG